MANVEYKDFVNALTEETTPDNAADFLALVDTSGSDVNKVKPSSILGTDLSAIRALSPSNDDIIQRKAGAWINRTIAQLVTDLNITPNATHTGEVTGSGALTVDKTAISGKTLVTAAVGDHVLIGDASDSDNLKKVTVQTIVDLAAGSVDIGDTIGSGTEGSILFLGASGVLAQDNSKIKWNATDGSLIVSQSVNYKSPLVLRQSAAQSPHGVFLEFQNYNEAVLGNLRYNGDRISFGSGVWEIITYGQNGGSITLDPRTSTANPLKVTSLQATSVPLLLQLASSQSADALQVKNSGGTTIASIDASGYFRGQADADTRLVNSSIGTWSFILEAGNARCSVYDGSNYLFRVDGDSTAGNTRMLIWDVDNGTLERVSVGAADSGGTGFKLLRIPN